MSANPGRRTHTTPETGDHRALEALLSPLAWEELRQLLVLTIRHLPQTKVNDLVDVIRRRTNGRMQKAS
jgi:hypothetical protein